jgi:hypothetical protein
VVKPLRKWPTPPRLNPTAPRVAEVSREVVLVIRAAMRVTDEMRADPGWTPEPDEIFCTSCGMRMGRANCSCANHLRYSLATHRVFDYLRLPFFA